MDKKNKYISPNIQKRLIKEQQNKEKRDKKKFNFLIKCQKQKKIMKIKYCE